MAELTRRELLKAGGATAAVIGVGSLGRPASAEQPPPGAWNHDPGSPIGPNHWVNWPALAGSSAPLRRWPRSPGTTCAARSTT